MIKRKVLNTMPWELSDEWEQVSITIRKFEDHYRESISHVYELAALVKEKIEPLSVLMEDLCKNTCPDCEDICCHRATIWYDFKDLLTIYFSTNQLPNSQIRKVYLSEDQRGCCHFSVNGCNIKRTERPFVCTWYICPSQKQHINHNQKELGQKLDQTLIDIKDLREKIECEFIKFVG